MMTTSYKYLAQAMRECGDGAFRIYKRKRQQALDRACRNVAPRHDGKVCYCCWRDWVPKIRAEFHRIMNEA